MKAIKDSVHGHVRLGDLAAELVDTPAFQRLRHIKQLSTVRLVYPSANHTPASSTRWASTTSRAAR